MTRALIRSKREFRARVDRAAFSSLIATPVAGAFTMPASGKISFVTRVDTIEGDDIEVAWRCCRNENDNRPH